MNVTVIAEAGVNHNGDIDLAIRLIDAAADAGADVVKFQTFIAHEIVSRDMVKSDYQRVTTDADETQFDMIKRLEMNEDAHRRLILHCVDRRIRFMSTPFDLPSVRLLADLGVDTLKVPSGELTNPLLIVAAAATGKPIIMSTGMSRLDEVETALGAAAFGYLGRDVKPSAKAFADSWASKEGRALVRDKLTLLHCTSEYPAPVEDVNLRAMDTLAETFGVKIGLSDHTAGIAVAIAAAARGATIIEKHFTLDRTMPGPDHQASLEPGELAAMVGAIRQVTLALGTGDKIPAPSEIKNIAIVRKCLVARTAIRKDEMFSEANLTVKRGTGTLQPVRYWDLLGTRANRDYAEDEAIVG